MNATLIETRGLQKSFGECAAVADLDLRVDSGSIVGIVGPNGSGKTTIFKMLLGLVAPTAGDGRVLGRHIVRDSLAIRRNVAFVPEDKLLYDDMRVRAFLRFYGSYFPAWDAAAAARLLNAWGVPEDLRIKALSKGMRAKLILAAAVARRPRILLLDEPTIDLDPAAAEDLLALLAQWTAVGDRCVLIATHRLDEVERICDALLLLEQGRELLQGNLDDLRAEWKRLVVTDPLPPGVTAELPGVQWAERRSGGLVLIVNDGAPALVERIRAAGASVECSNMNLREIYLARTAIERGRLDDAVEGLV